MPPSMEPRLDRQAQHRLAVLRHAEEVTGNAAEKPLLRLAMRLRKKALPAC